jgi:hypothetical protein
MLKRIKMQSVPSILQKYFEIRICLAPDAPKSEHLAGIVNWGLTAPCEEDGMTQLSNMQMTGFADHKASAHPDKYHPHCGDEHRHKPTKAVIGIAILIVLSFLLYGITGHANEPAASKVPPQTISHMR